MDSLDGGFSGLGAGDRGEGRQQVVRIWGLPGYYSSGA